MSRFNKARADKAGHVPLGQVQPYGAMHHILDGFRMARVVGSFFRRHQTNQAMVSCERTDVSGILRVHWPDWYEAFA